MAIRFDCDECGDEITDTLYFVKGTRMMTHVLAETHHRCFPKHVSSHMADWFSRYGIVEFGVQHLSAEIRPIHRNGTV